MTTASYKMGVSVGPTMAMNTGVGMNTGGATPPPVERPVVEEAPAAPEEDKEMDLAEADQYFMDVDEQKEVQPVNAKATTPTEVRDCLTCNDCFCSRPLQDERPASQLSDASSVQPTTLFGHAHKFVSSMLGSGKKGKATTKPEVKSLQLAAAAAKKVRVFASGSFHPSYSCYP